MEMHKFRCEKCGNEGFIAFAEVDIEMYIDPASNKISTLDSLIGRMSGKKTTMTFQGCGLFLNTKSVAQREPDALFIFLPQDGARYLKGLTAHAKRLKRREKFLLPKRVKGNKDRLEYSIRHKGCEVGIQIDKSAIEKGTR